MSPQTSQIGQILARSNGLPEILTGSHGHPDSGPLRVPWRPMTTQPVVQTPPVSLERPVAELLARVRPLPDDLSELVIPDLDEVEGAAFLAAITE